MVDGPKRLLGGDEWRRTRLHSGRGRLVPMTELVRLPGLMLSRRGAASDEPWMARGSIRRLDQLLRPDMRLLELGSGTSTAWYAARVAEVVSIEPNPEWADATRAKLAHVPQATVVTGPVAEIAPALLRDPRFDVVVVDHTHEPGLSRPAAMAQLGEQVKIAVLDDSDRPEYADVDRTMGPGWMVERYVSLRSAPLAATETSIFLRE
jgi:hypothetical protein